MADAESGAGGCGTRKAVIGALPCLKVTRCPPLKIAIAAIEG
jgi:hypothetical protein